MSHSWWIAIVQVLYLVVLVMSPLLVLLYARLSGREEQAMQAAFRWRRHVPLGRRRSFRA